MTLKAKFDQENDNSQNMLPLGNDEIKSILKTQSEAVFQDKNITNKSNFIKKSLIDIALDFETKQSSDDNEKTNSLENTEKIKEESTEVKNIQVLENKSKIDTSTIQENIEDNSSDKKNDTEKQLDQYHKELKLENQNINELVEDSNDLNDEKASSKNLKETTTETKIEDVNKKNLDEIVENEMVSESNAKIDETQQALDSVRDAVSQSIKKSDHENEDNFKQTEEKSENASEIILKDYNDFKNILSSLSNLSEKAVYDAVQNKIIDIAYDLAGYQIDKMPEKYEKKIKSLLKNINCFEDKMKIEVNNQDYEALSKIKNFFDNQDKSLFVSNQDLSRGDIILNCDGMHYSEKSKKH